MQEARCDPRRPEQRIEADLQLGRHSDVVAELQRLVEEEPLHERLWRHLMLALYRSDRQADALEVYRRARGRLRDELGLEPSEDLKELERAILHQDLPAAPACVERHNLPAPASSLVGRERELDEIPGLLRKHRLVTLTGVGGSGKTRLAIEMTIALAAGPRDERRLFHTLVAQESCAVTRSRSALPGDVVPPHWSS